MYGHCPEGPPGRASPIEIGVEELIAAWRVTHEIFFLGGLASCLVTCAVLCNPITSSRK